jgi:hypothetical protein
MYDLPFFLIRGMDIAEVLNAIHGIDINVLLVRLAEGLDLFRTSPNAIFPRLCDFGIKAPLFILGSRRRRASRGGGTVRIPSRRRCRSPGRSTFSTNGGNEIHEIFFVGANVIRETNSNFVGVIKIPIELVGERVV